MAKPKIVSAEEWKAARAALLVDEKRLTHELDALAAKRRRLPMVELENKYKFAGPRGSMTLFDLFDGRDQLIQYQFMDRGPDTFCPGCTGFTNNIATNATAEAPSAGSVVVQRLEHAARADRSVQSQTGLDDPVRVVARHDVHRRYRRERHVPIVGVPSRRQEDL
jgi:predicted dithiol-disulfide oxidoreductase (DUF899 family)